MEYIPLTFTPKESLQLLKEHNPQFWEVDLVKPRISILVKVINHGCSLTKALEITLKKTETMADCIIAMAAYQQIMNEQVNKYKSNLKAQEQIRTQKLYLNNDKKISHEHWVILTHYYNTKMSQLETEKKELLQDKDVCRALKVEFETVEPNSRS